MEDSFHLMLLSNSPSLSYPEPTEGTEAFTLEKNLTGTADKGEILHNIIALELEPNIHLTGLNSKEDTYNPNLTYSKNSVQTLRSKPSPFTMIFYCSYTTLQVGRRTCQTTV